MVLLSSLTRYLLQLALNFAFDVLFAVSAVMFLLVWWKWSSDPPISPRGYLQMDEKNVPLL